MGASQLLVGAATTDVTPPLHVPFLGFEPRQGVFQGVHDPLYARAAVFARGGDAVAAVSADALGLSTDLVGRECDFVAEVRRRAAQQTSLRPEAILLAATHAHSTPETSGITHVWERADCTGGLETFADLLASTVQRAWRDPVPATLTTGPASLPGLAVNRRARPQDTGRPETGCIDESVAVLLAERGAPLRWWSPTSRATR